MIHKFREFKYKRYNLKSEKMDYNVLPTREELSNPDIVFLMNTQLIDREKNEIYDRDIIEFMFKNKKLVGEVVYEPGRYVAKVKDSELDYISWKEDLDNVKVIGNYFSSKWYRK